MINQTLFLVATLLSAFFLKGTQAQPQNQVADAECREYTHAQVYAFNRNIGDAEFDYTKSVSDAIADRCMDYRTNTLRSCNITLDRRSRDALAYSSECEKVGGVMWQYHYSPKCGDSSVSQNAYPVLVCASPQCSMGGVQTMIPFPRLLDSLEDAGHTCGSGTNNLQRSLPPTNAKSAGRSSNQGFTALASFNGIMAMMLIFAGYFIL